MKYSYLIGLVTLLFACNPVPTKTSTENNTLYQVSTISSLLDRNYDGELTCKQLHQKGDFCIGTFNAIDGEMLGIDGKFYQIKTDGKAYLTHDTTRTPFAVATHFSSDFTLELNDTIDYEQLAHHLDSLLPTTNIFYALKIHGTFQELTTRSVPRQTKPYVPLVEIVKNQAVFEFQNTTGTLVGFRFPDYTTGMNVPGYHFHYITDDHTRGGHVLSLKGITAQAQIDSIHHLELELPQSEAFYGMQKNENIVNDIKKVEK